MIVTSKMVIVLSPNGCHDPKDIFICKQLREVSCNRCSFLSVVFCISLKVPSCSQSIRTYCLDFEFGDFESPNSVDGKRIEH